MLHSKRSIQVIVLYVCFFMHSFIPLGCIKLIIKNKKQKIKRSIKDFHIV